MSIVVLYPERFTVTANGLFQVCAALAFDTISIGNAEIILRCGLVF